MSRFSGFLRSGTVPPTDKPQQPRSAAQDQRRPATPTEGCARKAEPAASAIKPKAGEVEATVASIRRLNDMLADANELVVSIGLERDQAVRRADAAERRAEKAERELAEALGASATATPATTGGRTTAPAPRIATRTPAPKPLAAMDRNALKESILAALTKLGPSRWAAVLEHMGTMGNPIIIGARSDLMAEDAIVKKGEIYGIRPA